MLLKLRSEKYLFSLLSGDLLQAKFGLCGFDTLTLYESVIRRETVTDLSEQKF